MKNGIYSINRSRVGYAYQYKYALWCILKMLLGGRLKGAFVDLPFSYQSVTNLSLDLKLELVNPEEIRVYEIKTGDDFKKDKIEELKFVLRSLSFYEKNERIISKKFIIVSPDVESQILDHWNDFQFVRSRRRENFHKEKRQDVQERVFEKFGQSIASTTKKEFSDFIEDINFEIGPNYSHHHENDELADLEDHIKSEIDNFCNTLSVKASEVEIPSWSIGIELLECLSKSVEGNKEVSLSLLKKLSICLARRRLVREANYSGNKEAMLNTILGETNHKLKDITKITFSHE